MQLAVQYKEKDSKNVLCAFINDCTHDSLIKALALRSLFEFVEILKHTVFKVKRNY